MRKSVLIFALLLFVSSIQAQTSSLDGFLKSNWGSSKAVVINNNSTKGYNYYEGEGIGENMLIATDADFAGTSGCMIAWFFTSDKLFQGTVLISPELSAKAMTEYSAMRAKIAGKYGAGDTYENYDYPYDEGDGHWETAFKLGKGQLSTYWVFDDENTLGMELTEDLDIKITYQSTELIGEELDKREAANNDDL
jgi:hypothetical protein